MKPIQKDELFEHLRGFLQTKGIELKEGSYSQTIQKSCSILADAVNLSQRGIEKAKTGIDQKIDKMRQVIHEKTAPKTSGRNTAPTGSASPPQNESGATKTARPKSRVKTAGPKRRAARKAKQ